MSKTDTANDDIKKAMAKQILDSRSEVKEVRRKVNPSTGGASREALQKYASAVRNFVLDIEPIIKKYSHPHEDVETNLHWYQSDIPSFETLPEVKKYHSNEYSRPIEANPERVHIYNIEQFLERGIEVGVEVKYEKGGHLTKRRTRKGSVLIPLPWKVTDAVYREATRFLIEFGFLPDSDEDLPEGMEL